MDATAGLSPSLENIAAGLAGFALASLFSFARKPQVIKQDTPPAYSSPTGANGSYTTPDTAPVHYPGMGHDFHVLARVLSQKQHQGLSLPANAGPAEQQMRRLLESFRPQLAEFSNLEWRANVTGPNYPKASEMIGRTTTIAFVAESQSQGLGLAKSSEMIPFWSQSRENSSKAPTREGEGNCTRSIDNAAEECTDGLQNQRSRKYWRRGDESRRGHRGWCKGREDDSTPMKRGWSGPRDDYDERWGWARYREE
jgi:hypothetical protein